MRKLLVMGIAMLLGSCAQGQSDYPHLSDVPSRPDTTLTPDRSEALAGELREAGDEAVARASEGRPEGEAPDASGGEE